MAAAITVENLGKCYRVHHEKGRSGSVCGYRTLRESLVDLATAPLRRWRNGSANGQSEEFWALKDVSFEVQPGEVVGIIGRNGAGKSTLLKVLSRITKPTTGQVALRGRVGSLLEVGTGFHPELTGRENIYLNGSILGMSKKEIDRRFDEIVAFAEIEQFLDTPVKRYSSGMYVRLAFAVAAHLEPEILLVDEVLAVGDQEFQKRCLGKMGDIAASGRTVLLVSHNLATIGKLSDRVLYLDRGGLKWLGLPADVLASYYEETSQSLRNGASISLLGYPRRRSARLPILHRISLLDESNRLTQSIMLGDCLTVEVELANLPVRSDVTVVLDICDTLGCCVAQANSVEQSALNWADFRTARVRCTIRDLRILPGQYVIHVAVGKADDYIERIENAICFYVDPADIYGTGYVPSRRRGMIALNSCWELETASSARR